MENQLKLVCPKFAILAWRSKDGFECRAFGIDLGYSFKILSFKTQDIAEVLGCAVVDFVARTPVIDGQKTRYPVGV